MPSTGCRHRTRLSNPSTSFDVEGDDRLVDEFELTALECTLEIALQLQLGLFRFQNRGIEDLAVRATQHARTVQCGLRVVHDLVRSGVAGRADRNADARRQPDLASADREGIQQLTEDPIGGDLGVADIFQTIEQDREVVAVQSRDEIVVTQAGRHVRDAQARFQTAGDGREERVGDGR